MSCQHLGAVAPLAAAGQREKPQRSHRRGTSPSSSSQAAGRAVHRRRDVRGPAPARLAHERSPGSTLRRWGWSDFARFKTLTSQVGTDCTAVAVRGTGYRVRTLQWSGRPPSIHRRRLLGSGRIIRGAPPPPRPGQRRRTHDAGTADVGPGPRAASLGRSAAHLLAMLGGRYDGQRASQTPPMPSQTSRQQKTGQVLAVDSGLSPIGAKSPTDMAGATASGCEFRGWTSCPVLSASTSIAPPAPPTHR